jgi:ubiquinone/menaquinone biosynthesis C-methylase UbiE
VPRLDEIRATWDAEAGWSAAGEEWNGPWGSADALWWSGLLPRLRAFLPAGTVLEIAPGQGRWSRFLKDQADELILVDVAEHAIAACRRRFADEPHIAFHVGDGRSLPMVADGSVDLAFSFDSLVHAEADVLEAYAGELARTLAPEGAAFLHVSNMGAHRRGAAFARRLPEPVRRRATIHGMVPNVFAWRAESTTGEQAAAAFERAGLRCITLELIAWHYGRALTDALLLLVRPGSRWDRPRITARNPRFMAEARTAARIAERYAAAPRSSST